MIRVRLKELLQDRHLSLRELARRSDTHPDVLSRFGRNTTGGISYDLLNRLCRALACQPGDLLEYLPEVTQINLFTDEED